METNPINPLTDHVLYSPLLITLKTMQQ